MNILPKLISFQRLSKFLEQEGYSWVNLEKFEALAWNTAGKHAHLLCWGMCGIRDGGLSLIRMSPLPGIKNDSRGCPHEQELIFKGPSGPRALAFMTCAFPGNRTK